VIAACPLVGAVLLAAVGRLPHYRATYHTFAWWQVPSRISYRGRNYDRGTDVTALPAGYTVKQVMTVEPAGWAVYSTTTTNSGVAAVPGLPCTMGLALRRSDHELIRYALDGGP
jgi:hypothetical protein